MFVLLIADHYFNCVIVRNLRKKFSRTASTGIRKTRLASGTVRFADLLLKIDGTCSRGHDTPAKKKKKKKKKNTMYKYTKTHVIKGVCYRN